MDAEDADVGVGVDADVDADSDVGAVVDVDAIDAGRPSAEDASADGAAELAGMVVPELESTGHVEVDAALERLRVLSERPTGAHPDLYDGVHQRLQEVLAQIDHQDAGR